MKRDQLSHDTDLASGPPYSRSCAWAENSAKKSPCRPSERRLPSRNTANRGERANRNESTLPPNTVMMDHLEIREAIDNWVLWRDAGEWDRFATIWSPEGRMATTWSQSTFTEFIHNSRQAKSAGLRVLHFFAFSAAVPSMWPSIERSRRRKCRYFNALVCTTYWSMSFVTGGSGTPLKRATRGGAWCAGSQSMTWTECRRRSRREIAARRQLLASFPDGYQHLAYVQTHLGLQVSRTMPVTDGPGDRSIARARAPLAGRRWRGVSGLKARLRARRGGGFG